jgi:hypothetical protein
LFHTFLPEPPIPPLSINNFITDKFGQDAEEQLILADSLFARQAECQQ